MTVAAGFMAEAWHAGVFLPAVHHVWHVLGFSGDLRHLPAAPGPGCAI